MTNLILVDEQYDRSLVDLEDHDQVTFFQKDENGRDHIVILSHSMVMQLLPDLIQWSRLSQPTPTSP